MGQGLYRCLGCLDSESEADWFVEVEEVTRGHEGGATRCLECGSEIAAGAWRQHVSQLESAECLVCAHDYGEMFDCDLCLGCVLLRWAIEAVEQDEGCPPATRQPMYGYLADALHYGGRRYLQRALRDFPHLTNHPLVQVVLNDLEA